MKLSIPWHQNIVDLVLTRDVVILYGNIRDQFVFGDAAGQDYLGGVRELLLRLLSQDRGPMHFFDPIERLERGMITAGAADFTPAPGAIRWMAPKSDDGIVDAKPEDDISALLLALQTPLPALPAKAPTTENSPEVVRTLVVSDAAAWLGTSMQPDRSQHDDGIARRLLLLRKLVETLAPGRRLLLLYLDRQQIPFDLYIRSPRVGLIEVPLPGPDERRRAAVVSGFLPGDTPPAVREALLGTFGNLTEELPLLQVVKILEQPSLQHFADDKGQHERIKRAVHRHKFGERNDPYGDLPVWKLLQAKSFFINGENWDRDRKHLIEKFPGILGQDEAVDAVERMLWRAKTNVGQLLRDPGSMPPRGVLHFTGPTGTGKTMLSKRIAKFFFDSEESFVRFDMSEFSQDFAVTKLIGAPPGYVGSAEGGLLTNALIKNPYTVVLFDEVEKAHPRILDVFLQILSDGRLTDSHGQTAFFSEAIIVFTSNLGMRTQRSGMPGSLGSLAAPCNERARYDQLIAAKSPWPLLREHFMECVRDYYETEISRPELLNRMGNNIVPFQAVSGKNVVHRMFGDYLEKIRRRFAEVHADQGMSIDIGPDVLGHFVRRHEATVNRFGGRAVVNVLEDEFLTELAKALVATDGERDKTFRARIHRDRITIR